MAENALDRFVRQSLSTGIRRRSERRWVAGVCVGLAARYGVDPVLFRVGFLLLSLFGGIGIPVYLMCWLLLPAEDDTVALDRAVRGGDGIAITLMVFTIIAVVGTLTPDGDKTGLSFLGLVAVAGIVWLLVRSRSAPGTVLTSPHTQPESSTAADPTAGEVATTSAPDTTTSATPVNTPTAAPVTTSSPDALTFDRPEDRTPPLVNPLLGEPQDVRPHPSGWAPQPIPTKPPTSAPARVARRRGPSSWLVTLIAAGLAILAYVGLDLIPVEGEQQWMVPMAGSLAVLGLVLIVTAITRHRPPLVTLSAWALAISLLASMGAGTTSVGDTVWRPTSVAALETVYDGGIGTHVLDLTAVPVGAETHRVRVSHGVGDLEIRLPSNARTSVTTQLGLGAVHVVENGHDREIAAGNDVTTPIDIGTGHHAYDIELDAGVGEITVRLTDTPAPAIERATP